MRWRHLDDRARAFPGQFQGISHSIRWPGRTLPYCRVLILNYYKWWRHLDDRARAFPA